MDKEFLDLLIERQSRLSELTEKYAELLMKHAQLQEDYQELFSQQHYDSAKVEAYDAKYVGILSAIEDAKRFLSSTPLLKEGEIFDLDFLIAKRNPGEETYSLIIDQSFSPEEYINQIQEKYRTHDSVKKGLMNRLLYKRGK